MYKISRQHKHLEANRSTHRDQLYNSGVYDARFARMIEAVQLYSDLKCYLTFFGESIRLDQILFMRAKFIFIFTLF